MDIKWLAKQLERPGYSQTGLAKALGKSASAVSRILSGERQLKAAELPIILKYLKLADAPPSPQEEQDFHAALGRAVSTWNMVELEIWVLLTRAFPKVGASSLELIGLIYESNRVFSDRLEIVDRVLSVFLANRRNDRDAWRALRDKIERASHRRDTYVRAIGVPRDTGEMHALEFFGTDILSQVDIKQLIEDHRHFDSLWKETMELATTIAAD